MRPMPKKGSLPLLFLATVVDNDCEWFLVSQVVGRREDSSPLLVDNGPPTKDGEDNDDGGLRTVDDDILPVTTQMHI